ncbi:hypothetical protein [Arsenicicoccus dermatophilus]|uniref:hypothetical protein n=1 Tax=Arsenicicoccus dermatophilus TaxID=1076331 RepID=UPI001F4C5C14|nr:hypothetical protein [Arsenicicoccus dermatophilus]MCH8614132.1 hypothetical protein [Arsenicicoccus dermatophilus]
MEWLLWLAAGVSGVVALDLVGRRAERRGWIYWRSRRRGSMGLVAGPLLEVFSPAHAHVVEERDRQRLQIQQTERSEPDEAPCPDGP